MPFKSPSRFLLLPASSHLHHIQLVLICISFSNSKLSPVDLLSAAAAAIFPLASSNPQLDLIYRFTSPTSIFSPVRFGSGSG
jgi:hypothetical protein